MTRQPPPAEQTIVAAQEWARFAKAIADKDPRAEMIAKRIEHAASNLETGILQLAELAEGGTAA